MRKGFNGLHALVTEKLAARAVEPDTCLNVPAPPADPTGLRTKVRATAAQVRFRRTAGWLRMGGLSRSTLLLPMK